MITDSPTFCPAPWTSLNIDQTGRVSPCMHALRSIGNIKNTPIQQIITGESMQIIRDHMARGEWHQTCQLCKQSEETTGSSARTVRRIDETTKESINNSADWFVPEHLVINWSNLCNLNCVYCNPDASTAWQSIKGIPINHVKNEHADLIALAKLHGHHVQGLTLGGGEPLLQKGLSEFLQCLDPSKVRVMVTTNLSVDLENNKIYQELKDWPSIDWQISFDNVDPQRFEYVRAGASWKTFVKNLQLMKQQGQHVIAHPAYSIYCAYDLESYYEFCIEQDLDLFWCDLTHPWDLDVRRLSKPLREQAQQHIDNIIEKFSSHEGLAIDTLSRYKILLEDNSNLTNIDTYTADPLGYARQIEQELNLSQTFEQLWPELVVQLKEHYYV